MLQRARRDFGTLRTVEIVGAGHDELLSARTTPEQGEVLAGLLLAVFDDFYARHRGIPLSAKAAFEARDWPRAVELSRERIAIFSVSIAKVVPLLREALRDAGLGASPDDGLWRLIERSYGARTAPRYEADLAMAYLAAVRRALYQEIWDPLTQDRLRSPAPSTELRRAIPVGGQMTPAIVGEILAVPKLGASFRDAAADARLVAERITEELRIGPDRPLEAVTVVDAGFYRNRGAFVIGAITVAGVMHPIALALLHPQGGIVVDAVILDEATLTHLFSSTLANFHVTELRYHELADQLQALMPSRSLALHYTTVGYNHVGKLAVIRHIMDELAAAEATLDHAPGSRGSVAIGFTAPSIDLVLKVIRDNPTDQYKWDRWDGAEAVLAKYMRVHEVNRAGSMLDNIVYSSIVLPRALFAPALVEEMVASAGASVSVVGEKLLFKHLIVQRKVVPLPLYLAACTPEAAATIVNRLGQCIRNNAAINVFNKDLDGRNYGVSHLGFVYLFDYDAIEELLDVKIRTNAGREDGEEDVPAWVFESGIVFLAEELEAHLKLPDQRLRRIFREKHGELLTVDYWTGMQRLLAEGQVPRVKTYADAMQLRPSRPGEDAPLTTVL